MYELQMQIKIITFVRHHDYAIDIFMLQVSHMFVTSLMYVSI